MVPILSPGKTTPSSCLTPFLTRSRAGHTTYLRSIVDIQCIPPTQGGVARELFVLHEECHRITCLTVCTVEETLSLAINQRLLPIKVYC